MSLAGIASGDFDSLLVDAIDVVKHFPIKGGFLQRTVGWVRAVDCVSFGIRRGVTFGLVGESGSGKTTLARCVLRLIEPTSGTILFNGHDFTGATKRAVKATRRDMGIVFQDPFASLDPRMRVKDVVAEPLIISKARGGMSVESRVSELLGLVGLTSEHLERFPHELSGGQRQRVAIARALALNPKFIVLDEPTSSLDVSVQAQILNLLRDLQAKLELTYLFISHNLPVVSYMSDRVGVMYLGKLVEVATTQELFSNPLHPYTQILLASALIPDPSKKGKVAAPLGETPSAVNPPPGCRFHTRCPYVFEKCTTLEPELRLRKSSREVACHLYE